MPKIQEIIIEPTKIKVIKHLIYKEIKTKTYKYFKSYKYKDLKGA